MLSCALIVATLGLAAADLPDPVVFDFEADAVGAVPEGWFRPAALVDAGVTVEIAADRPAGGEQCVRLAKAGDGVGNVMRSFDAAPYRGLRVRLEASVRVDGLGPASRAQMWVRIDRESGFGGFFDNMQDRPIRRADWDRYEIVGDVAHDAAVINFGLLVFGPGTAWLDDVRFTAIGEAGEGLQGPAPLTDEGLENLTALTRLFGLVRHFHPADEAAGTDWHDLAVRAVHAVEPAEGPGDLAVRLREVFAPVAPTVTVVAGRVPPDPGGAATPPGAEGWTWWEHLGFGQHVDPVAPRQNIYHSSRPRRGLDDEEGAAGEAGEHAPPRPGDAALRDLGGGVRVRVPLCLYYGADGTLPSPGADGAATPRWTPPEGWFMSANDRATRLAAVIVAWNVFQHFYPYFDVVETDWEAALAEALRGAAEDPDGEAFAETLCRLVGHLHDGHGRVSGPGAVGGRTRLPFEIDWVGDDLVVTAVHGEGAGVDPGDAILALDGRAPGAIRAELDPLISSATRGWMAYRTRTEILRRAGDDPAALTLRRPGGAEYSVHVDPIAVSLDLGEPRPDQIDEIRPGIWYVDMSRITDEDFDAAADDLAAARGVIFDLRGYPGRLSTVVIGHLIDEPVTCAQWHVPKVRWPDREKLDFRFSDWAVFPRKRFEGRVAFVTDGRAISYAETYLAIVEHYRLAEIVGAPTAGTNGNVNPIRLPGGHVLSWTGMKVLKHDGSRHHGVGIIPTVPAARTIEGIAEGRDELLEKAIEVVGGE